MKEPLSDWRFNGGVDAGFAVSGEQEGQRVQVRRVVVHSGGLSTEYAQIRGLVLRFERSPLLCS